MKKLRLIIQVIALLLQVYFIVETVRLCIDGYAVYMGQPIESSWYSMLFTLIIVTACEVVSFVEAIIFNEMKKSKYSKLYLALVIVNGILFMTMAYYSTVGTTICMISYAVIFILRIVNLVTSCIDVFKKTRA